MYSINKHSILGRLGKDPETKTIKDKTVATFSMATFEKWKDQQGNEKEKTEWHNIVIWGKPAEIIAKYVKKGDLLYVEGQVRTRSWEKDGSKFYATETFATDFMLMPNGEKKEKASSNSQPTSHDDSMIDDLPF